MEGAKQISDSRCFLAEFLGTFVLTFADASISIAHSLGHSDIDYVSRCLTPGLVVMAMIFSVGELSGAHINPAVTLSFTLRGVFPKKKIAGYVASQIFGAVFAALILMSFFGKSGNLGVTIPERGTSHALFYEIILSFILVFVILATSHQHKIKGPEAAFPVGGTVAACGLLGKFFSQASMNPARSLGPALVSGNLSDVWIFVVGPCVGATVATFVVSRIHGPPKSDDQEAAQGEKNLRKT